MSLLVLSAADVDQVTSQIDHTALTSLMASVFSALSNDVGISAPHRTTVQTGGHTSLFMPARLGDCTAMKVVSVPRSASDTRGLPGSTLVMDEATGAVRAIVNARALTALRTAAGSLLATQMLLKRPDPVCICALGTGAQVRAHVELHLQAYPSLRILHIFARDPSSARAVALKDAIALHHPHLQLTLSDLSAPALHDADIICSAVPSTSPVFDSVHVSPNTHINLIGAYTPAMIEAAPPLVQRAGTIVVDSRGACLVEAGDLLQAGINWDGLVELGELVNAGAVADMVGGPDGVTIFKSVGVGVQDVAIARLVVERAEEMGIGTRVASYDA